MSVLVGAPTADLTKDLPGRWGKVTSRAEAQVIRWALIYCLLDGKECIEVSHLQTAEALWNYCSESARWAFMELSQNAQKLLAAVENRSLTLTQISKDVFRGNLDQARIEMHCTKLKTVSLLGRVRLPGGKQLLFPFADKPNATLQPVPESIRCTK